MKQRTNEELAELVKAAPDSIGDLLSDFNKRMDEFSKHLDAEQDKWAEENPVQAACDHGVVFDEEEYKKVGNMSDTEVRKRWPRLMGACPKGCGFNGIGYASYLHYIAGDW
jgi:hypothetical protein